MEKRALHGWMEGNRYLANSFILRKRPSHKVSCRLQINLLRCPYRHGRKRNLGKHGEVHWPPILSLGAHIIAIITLNSLYDIYYLK
ncbi:unnamed protein product, partial [Vitis vinifera]|uniref:Uncharacterized protein n=1 Tax=Vitis vinifera TaxID=29760 RepID=D7TXP4_VITVI